MDKIKAVCNWTRIGGCDWEQSIQTKCVDDEIVNTKDVFVLQTRPQIADILHDERAILLHRKTKVEAEEAEICELELKVFPRYKVSALTIICTVPKIEVFIGSQAEYYETEHGHLMEEDIDIASDLHTYRYDIEIDKSGIIELTLKLLTNSDEICIFALLLQIAPNPNGITTLLPNGINIENVQKMLESSNQKLTPNAEKCKQLLQMCSKATALKATEEFTRNASEETLEQIKIYIDKRIDEMESRFMTRLDLFEGQLSAKLDDILKAVRS